MAPLGDLGVLVKEAEGHLGAGRIEQAEQVCQMLLAGMPDQPQALMILSVVRMAQERFREAESLLQRGAVAHPKIAGFHAGLARFYLHLQRFGDALEPLENCVLLDPANRDHRAMLVALYQRRQFASFSQESKRAMLACLADAALTHSLMAKAWLSLLRLDPQSTEIERLFQSPDYESFRERATPELFSAWQEHELLNRGLQRFLVADPVIERGLTFARRWFFEQKVELDRFEPLLCTLANYCFFTEYAFVALEDPEALRAQLSTPAQVALLGCYEPLFRLEHAERLATFSAEPHYRELVRTQIREPLEEIRIQADIPALSAIDDDVSRAVQNQYEQNPYPRWSTLGGNVAMPESVTAQARGKNILIAGCGTGREAADAALIFPAARVDAIDLSRTSLAYGIRKARELGLGNVHFMQADILELARLGTRFELIVCSGVLHHMRSPLAGLEALLAVLGPQGLLKLGLYSTIARSAVVEARAWIKSAAFAPTPDGIRAFRAAVLARSDDDPLKQQLTKSYDFYSVSQCRDFVFHVEEHTFTLLEIADIARKFGLSVLRIETKSPAHLKAYQDRFPDDRAALDLTRWHVIEEAHPALFAGLYSIWFCRSTEQANVDMAWIRSTQRM